MVESKSAYIYASLTIIFWASTAAVASLMLENLNSLQVLFYTSLIAFLSLLIIVFFQRKLHLVLAYRIKDYWNFAYMGFIGVFMFYALLFAGYMFAPAQQTLIIVYSWPIWVVIFAGLFLKEKLTFTKIGAIILGFIGVYVVVTQGNLFSFSFSYLIGNLFAFAAAICYGIFSILGKKHNYDKFTSVMFYYVFTLIFVTIANLLFSSIPAVSTYELTGLIWLGIFPSGLAFVFWFLALKHGDTATMSNLVFLVPFLSLVFIFFLLGERILVSSLVGLLLVIAGIVLQSYRK